MMGAGQGKAPAYTPGLFSLGLNMVRTAECRNNLRLQQCFQIVERRNLDTEYSTDIHQAETFADAWGDAAAN